MGTEDMAEIDVREIDEDLLLSKLAGNTKHLQSRLTAIEQCVVNTKLTNNESQSQSIGLNIQVESQGSHQVKRQVKECRIVFFIHD